MGSKVIRRFLAVSIVGVLLFLFSGISCVFAQEDISITTYYPAPYGVYKDLQTDNLTYEPQDSEPVACNSECEGLTYYGKVDSSDPERSIYLCNGSEWIPISELVGEDMYLGGYQMSTPFDYSVFYPTKDGRTPMPGVWTLLDPEGRVRGYKAYGFGLNFKSLPRGIYVFEWEADIDVDQYLGGTNSVDKKALTSFLFVRQYGVSDLDYSVYFTDETFDKDSLPPGDIGESVSWVDPTKYSTYHVDRSFTISYKAGRRKSDQYRNYGIGVYRQKANKFMKVRVRNAKLTVSFSQE